MEEESWKFTLLMIPPRSWVPTWSSQQETWMSTLLWMVSPDLACWSSDSTLQLVDITISALLLMFLLEAPVHLARPARAHLARAAQVPAVEKVQPQPQAQKAQVCYFCKVHPLI